MLFIQTKQVFVVNFGIILLFIVLVLQQSLSGKGHPFRLVRVVILSINHHALNHILDLLVLSMIWLSSFVCLSLKRSLTLDVLQDVSWHDVFFFILIRTIISCPRQISMLRVLVLFFKKVVIFKSVLKFTISCLESLNSYLIMRLEIQGILINSYLIMRLEIQGIPHTN